MHSGNGWGKTNSYCHCQFSADLATGEDIDARDWHHRGEAYRTAGLARRHAYEEEIIEYVVSTGAFIKIFHVVLELSGSFTFFIL